MEHLIEKHDDAWVTTSCNGCFNVCAIQVHRKDGKVVDIKGDPKVESSKGKICGKGKSRIADLYNPNRVTKPLRRTNPQKGIGVDPKWEEIDWKEATDIIVEKLKKIRSEDPRKLVFANFDLCNYHIAHAFAKAYGTPNDEFYTVSCGNGLHTVFFLTLGALNSEIDLDYCNYMILWGSQLGHGVNNNPLENIAAMAQARKRGAKLVVVDPICGTAAAKADEWIPIRPGTDAALALGMLNVLINELGIYDEEFLKHKTNAAYLVGEDGRYIRDKKSGKPMVWDCADGKAKVFDSGTIGDFALEGTYAVGGADGRPAFDLLRAHVKEHYSLKRVSKITTVPEEMIRRIAAEFGQAARIGSTIQIEGTSLPLRPAAVEFKRGVTHHKNGFFNVFSLQLLNIVVGNINVPGGLLGTNPNGPVNYWKIFPDKEGMMTSDIYQKLIPGHDSFASFRCPYPANEVYPPESLNLRGLFPLSGFLPGVPSFPILDPERFSIPYKPEMLILCRTNMMISQNNPQAMAEMLRKFDFILGFAIKIDESLEFADIILPEAHDLEKHWFFPVNQPAGFQKPGPGNWYFQMVQPVVDPPADVRNWVDVMIDLGERIGMLPELNDDLNNVTNLVMVEGLKLRRDKRYSLKEITGKTVELFAMLGGQTVTPDLFTTQKPVLDIGKKKLEECYTTPFTTARIPIYLEHLIDVGKKVREVTDGLGMDWWDTSHYQPLADWRPCPAYEENSDEYDLFVASSRLPLHNHSVSADNPWIDDVCAHSRLDYNILLNTETARKKGIEDGDIVCIESRAGKVKGKVRVTECVHPEVVGDLGGHLGQWATHKTISRGKGIHHNALLNFDWNMVGTITGQLDTCAKVKIYKEK